MKKLSSRFSVLATVAVISVSTFVSAQDESTLSHLTDYRRWTKMNSEPVKIETQLSAEVVSGMSTPV